MRTRSEDLCLKVRNVCWSVDGKAVLNNMSMTANTGQVLAVMGPTGSGKTTLLNVISGRTKHDSGTVRLNGATFTKRLRRRMAFVQQEDVFFSQLTLLETLMFAANLRMPTSISQSEKRAVVDKIISELELNKCINTVMGDHFTKGLSGGEKKRASIASELIVDPDILLLDEPTSNLDSSTALSISRCLKTYATSLNKMIVLTIHQPSSTIYQLFDRLLLLADGNVCYFGERENVLPFFEGLGHTCGVHVNPADFLMEQLKSEEDMINQMVLKSASARRMSTRRNTSQTPTEGINGVKSIGDSPTNIDEVQVGLLDGESDGLSIDMEGQDGGLHETRDRWVTSWWAQYKVLSGRSVRQTTKVLLQGYWPVQAVIVAVIGSMGYFQTHVSYETSRDVFGLLFFVSSYWTFLPAMDTIASYGAEKSVLRKERASGAYRVSAFFMAHLTGELPIIFTMPVVQFTFFFWMTGMGEGWQYFAGLLVLMVHASAAFAVGLSLSAFCDDARMAITCLFSYLISSYLVAGFYNRSMPTWFRWIKYLSLFHYPFASLSSIIIQAVPDVPCNRTLASEHYQACEVDINASITRRDMLIESNIDLPIYGYIVGIISYTIGIRIVAYIIVRFKRRAPV